MSIVWNEIRHSPMLWLLLLVPVVLVAEKVRPEAHTMLFVLSVLAIVPLATMLSHATESVAVKTGDMVGGLLNATLGNLTELIIALSALNAGEFVLVKASIAGAVVSNALFMLGASFLLGGLKYHTQDFNRAGARLQAGLMLLASIALLIPSMLAETGEQGGSRFIQDLSLALAVLLLILYGLGLLFSMKTHHEFFASSGGESEQKPGEEASWPFGLSVVILGVVTVFIAFVSEIFVGSVQAASVSLGMSQPFVGFIVVALVGGAAEMTSAFSAARKNRLDLSVSISLGSSAQIALFVAPVAVLASYVLAPSPMDIALWPGAVLMVLISTVTAAFVTSSGRSAWFVGVLLLAVYFFFAVTLYLLPPKVI
jgi:Ca2+:H+ antiporter